MDGWQTNLIPKSSSNQPKIGTGIFAGIHHSNVIVIGDSTPAWRDDVINSNRISVKISAEKAYAGGKLDCNYLGRCFSPWDTRLATWFAGQKKRHKPLCYDTLAAYFKVAAQKQGKCTILLYESEQTLARHGAKAMLGFIEKTIEYCWYVLVGNSSLNGLEIPEYMRPRRIDIADFNLTLRELKIYFSASNILLTNQQYEQLYQLIGGWTLAAYMVNKHMKRGEAVHEIDLDTAITEVFVEIDDLVTDGMTLQERYIATLLSEFDSFPYELALACFPYNEKTIRKALEKTPGIRYAKNGASLALHPLIRAYWQTKWHEVPKKLRDGSKNRAAKWYAANKEYMSALICAVDAGGYPLARSILRRMNTKQYHQRAGDIAKVLERIDERYLEEYPMLWAYKVALYFTNMDRAKGNQEKEALEQFLAIQCETPDARQAKGEMVLLTAFTRIVDPLSLVHFKNAAEYFEGGSEVCTVYLNDTIRNGTPIPYDGSKEYSLLDTCRLIQKAAPYRYQCTHNWGRGHEHLCYAEYGYLTGNAPQLIENAHRALSDAIAYQQLYIAKAANLITLLYYTNVGMVNEAVDSLRSINTLAQMESDSSKVILDAANARVCFCTGQLYLLPQWVRDADEFESRVKCYQPGREYYIRGCYLMYKGQLQNAIRLVSEAMGYIRFTDEWITRLQLMALKTMIYLTMDDYKGAQAQLNEYYESAAPERLTTPLLEFNKYTVKLMDYFLHIMETQPEIELPPAGWMEEVRQGAVNNQNGREAFFTGYYKWLQEKHGTSLSGNEYIVLQLFCLGYSYDGIKKELGIKKNYINSVMSRVCKKFGVNSAEEAIAYGRSINIQECF